MLPPNQIWLDPSTSLGQGLFLPILASVQQGFRATQTTKCCVLDVVRRLTLGNSQSDTRQACLDALAPAMTDTTLLLRAVGAHEEVPASSAGLEHVAANLSVVAGGVVIIYLDETLDSAEGPEGPDSTGVVLVINMNTGGLDNIKSARSRVPLPLRTTSNCPRLLTRTLRCLSHLQGPEMLPLTRLRSRL